MKIFNALILSTLCTTTFFSHTKTFDETIRLNIAERQATKQFVETIRKCSIGYALAWVSLFLIIYKFAPAEALIKSKVDIKTPLLPWLVCTAYSTYNNLQIEALEAELNKLLNKK